MVFIRTKITVARAARKVFGGEWQRLMSAMQAEMRDSPLPNAYAACLRFLPPSLP
jgi:hypothetical protein